MPFLPIGRFGWSDSVGPLWFLRERWTVGPRWRSCWARYFASPRGVTLQAHTKKERYGHAGMYIPWDLWCDLSYAQKEEMVMGWLRAVRRPDGPLGSGGVATDADWMREYPALFEYVTAGVNPDGSVRRTATLTLFADSGSWKCYLNERDAGASLCATGDTVAHALSALEVMLESENPPWRFVEASGHSGSKKGRKGS